MEEKNRAENKEKQKLKDELEDQRKVWSRKKAELEDKLNENKIMKESVIKDIATKLAGLQEPSSTTNHKGNCHNCIFLINETYSSCNIIILS